MLTYDNTRVNLDDEMILITLLEISQPLRFFFFVLGLKWAFPHFPI